MEPISSTALLWIVLLPLLGAILNGALTVFGIRLEKGTTAAIGIASVAGAFILSVLSFLALREAHEAGGVLRHHVYDWFDITLSGHTIPIGVTFVMDALSGVMCLFVTGIGLLIHIYSAGYMAEDAGFARFFTYLNLFMASMLILVLGSSMPLLFVGWEGVGLCSYLLIGFWFENGAYAQAGKKAFIMNRIGDFGVLIGMFILMKATGSLEFADINGSVGTLEAGHFFIGSADTGLTLATAACLFLFLGCTGKSAQVPLFVWLPDAMAGPTPVSALIHAATMVTAGVYLCCRLSFVFLASPTAMAVITVVGAFTALLAASIALVQNQMKKILAYSTVSQLGFMFAAVGAGAFSAGFFHVFTHAFFKACLFLGAGAVMHAVHAHGDADVRLLGGLRKHLPTIHWTFLLSCMAIAGVPLFSGWFSKDEILMGAWRSTEYFEANGLPGAIGYLVFGMLVLAATFTAFYMFRMYFLAFGGDKYRSEDGGELHGHHAYEAHPHRPDPSIAWPLRILGVGAVVAGLINIEALAHFAHSLEHYAWLPHWLEPSVAGFKGTAEASFIPAIGGFCAMGIGIGLAYAMYGTGKTMPAENPVGFHKLLLDKWRVDELYDATVVRGMKLLAKFSGAFDKFFIDAVIARLTSGAVRLGSFLFTRLQNGVVYAYGGAMAAGLLLVGGWLSVPHPNLRVADVQGDEVSFTAAKGHGYAYRWDLNDDGEFGDGPYQEDFRPDADHASHRYGAADHRGLVARLVGTPVIGEKDYVFGEGDSAHSLSHADFRRGWKRDDDASGLPHLRREGDEIVVVPNAAIVSGRREGKELRLKVGDVLQIGGRTLQVGALVRGAVQVRNIFGAVRTARQEAVVFPKPPVAERKAPAIPTRRMPQDAIHMGLGGGH